MDGEIVAHWTENGYACLAVRVEEAEGEHVEYIGRVPLSQEGRAAWEELGEDERRAVLIAAVKTQRDAQVAPAPVAGITGTVRL